MIAIVDLKLQIAEDFNWLAVLKDLAAGATLTPNQQLFLRAASMRWPSCACGQLCSRLPRDSDGAPVDAQLRTLGIFFAQSVFGEEWRAALRTFHDIEDRVSQLLEKSR